MTHISLAAKAVHFIPLQPVNLKPLQVVHLKPLQVVHLFRCTQELSLFRPLPVVGFQQKRPV